MFYLSLNCARERGRVRALLAGPMVMVLLAAAHSRSLHFTLGCCFFIGENGAVIQCAVQNVREMIEDVSFGWFLGECLKYFSFNFLFCSAARFSLWGELRWVSFML